MSVPIASARRSAASNDFPLSESIVAGIVSLIDATITLASGVTLFFVYLDPNAVPLSLYAIALILTTYIVVHSFHLAHLYDFERIVHPGRQFPRIAGACSLVFVVLVALAFVFKTSEDFSRVWAIAWLIATVVGIQIGRFLVATTIGVAAMKGLLSRRILVYGTSEFARDFITNMQRSNKPWNKLVGVYDDRATRTGPTTDICPVSGNLDALIDTVRKKRVDEVLVALPWAGVNDRVDHILRKLSILPVNVNLSLAPDLAKYLHQGVHTEFGIPTAPVFARPIIGWRAIVKRIFDATLALFILALIWPLLALISIAIKLDSPGPVFFRQQRFGFNDELIRVWKFRTMYQNQTDLNAERLATPDDPRVTRVGSFLRRSSLDELPQLFNVLLGDMSLVGPRPHATRARAAGRLYQEVIEGYASRHRVKPGLTGWAQVNGWRGETDTDEKIIQRVEHDLYYISHWSLWLDIQILFRTVKVVLKGENAY